MEQWAVETILVATDGSESASRAVDFAARMSIKYAASLLIINVVGGYGLPGQVLREFSDASGVWLQETLTSLSAETLKSAMGRAHALGARDVVLESRPGNVARAILAYADEKSADAIIVGKQGASRLADALLGNVSEKLVNLANRVVIVVP
jgi:nucleotide-binding universal stress UspA family protein